MQLRINTTTNKKFREIILYNFIKFMTENYQFMKSDLDFIPGHYNPD